MNQRRLDLGQGALVVAGQVQAQVVVIDRGQLNVGERARLRDRGVGAEQLGEVAVTPARGEQQPVGSPAVAARERPQRRLEDPRVPVGGRAANVEEQQPVVAWRDRVAVGVDGERVGPAVLPFGQLRRLVTERDQRKLRLRLRRRSGARLLDDDAGRDSSGGQRRPPDQEPAAGEVRRSSMRWAGTHPLGFQSNENVTRWGLSQTFLYSTWRAETGGLTSSDSW